MRRLLQAVGKTPDGVVAIKGVFPLVDTHGIPLDLVLDSLKDKGMMPDWHDYVAKARKAGWRLDRTVRQLSVAVGDVYGPDFRTSWEARMTECLEVLFTET